MDMTFRRVSSATLLAKERECQLYQQTAFSNLINRNDFHRLSTDRSDTSQKKVFAMEK